MTISPNEKAIDSHDHLNKKGGLMALFGQHAKSLFTNPAKLSATGIGIALLSTTALSTGILPMILATSLASTGALMGLIGASDIVVENAEKIGNKLGLSPVLIGTIAGIITSLPELFVSGLSAVGGSPEIGVGNIIGSNVANIMLILGATSLYKGISNKGLDWKFNAAVMGVSTLGMGALMATGIFNPFVGGAMIAMTAAYAVTSYLKDKKKSAHTDQQDEDQKQDQTDTDTHETKEQTSNESLWKMGAWAAAGIGALLFSANALVNNASMLALGIGVTPALVSLIGVAIGTSLPELMVSLNSARKGNPGLAIGNVFGSNIFNILMVGGATALFSSSMPAEFMPNSPMGMLNMAALIGSAAWAVKSLWSGGQFSRMEGAASLGLYAGFCAASFFIATGAMTSALIAAPVAALLVGGATAMISKYLDKKDAKAEFNNEASGDTPENHESITSDALTHVSDEELQNITSQEVSNDIKTDNEARKTPQQTQQRRLKP